MKSLKVITDPEDFQLLADDTRRKIVFLLRAKEMTVSQISEHMKLTPQAVYHHIKKLLKAGMVEVAKEVRVDHLIESYYRTTAEVFHCNVGKAVKSKKAAAEQTLQAFNALKKLGFGIEFTDKDVAKMICLQAEYNESSHKGECDDKISAIDDVDFVTKQMVYEYCYTLSMTDEEFAKQQDLQKKTREILCSLMKKGAKSMDCTK